MELSFNYILNEEFEKVKGNFENFIEKEIIFFSTSLINAIMFEERNIYLGCLPYERVEKRKTISSGFHPKKLFFKFGTITVRIPETRDQGFYPEIMKKYSHHGIDLEKMIKSLVMQGLSTDKASKILNKHFSISYSKGNISNIIKSFDDDVLNFHKRELSDDYVYLYCDGVYETIKGFKKHNKKVVLAIYGIREKEIIENNKSKKIYSKELVDYIIANSETEQNWQQLLENIQKRGLEGRKLKLIIHDKNKGLMNALNFVYPFIKTQYCIYHKMQNSIKKLEDSKNRKEFSKDLSNLYKKNKDISIFYKKLNVFRKKWIDKEQDAVKNFLNDVHKTLRYFYIKKKYRKFITTNNIIERFFKEIRRRTKLIEGLEDVKSLDRFFYHICDENDFIKLNKEERNYEKI